MFSFDVLHRVRVLVVGRFAFPFAHLPQKMRHFVPFSPCGLRPWLPFTAGFRWPLAVCASISPCYQTFENQPGSFRPNFSLLLRSFCTLWDTFSWLRTLFSLPVPPLSCWGLSGVFLGFLRFLVHLVTRSGVPTCFPVFPTLPSYASG